MKHCMVDYEAGQRTGFRVIVYSCEFDNGKRARRNIVRIGECGQVALYLCDSCMEQLKGQILSPLIVEALQKKNAMTIQRTDHVGCGEGMAAELDNNET
jgi:hypothetical protein